MLLSRDFIEVFMDQQLFLRRAIMQAGDNQLVLNALRVARRALELHNGITAFCEGDTFTLDFTPEIRMVSSAVELMRGGVVAVPPPRDLEKTINLDGDEQPSDEARVLHALHVARYALTIHGGMGAVVAGQKRILDFKPQTDLLTEAMELMGIDMSKPLHAPMPRADSAGGDDD